MRRDDSNPPGRPGGQGARPPGEGQPDEESRADQEHLHDLQRARQSKVAKVLVLLAIVVIFMIFIISNDDPATVNFVFFTRRPPLIWVMFACAVLGGIVGYVIGRPGRQVRLHRRRRETHD
jgi:uncharacterized integral membrane protein